MLAIQLANSFPDKPLLILERTPQVGKRFSHDPFSHGEELACCFCARSSPFPRIDRPIVCSFSQTNGIFEGIQQLSRHLLRVKDANRSQERSMASLVVTFGVQESPCSVKDGIVRLNRSPLVILGPYRLPSCSQIGFCFPQLLLHHSSSRSAQGDLSLT